MYVTYRRPCPGLNHDLSYCEATVPTTELLCRHLFDYTLLRLHSSISFFGCPNCDTNVPLDDVNKHTFDEYV